MTQQIPVFDHSSINPKELVEALHTKGFAGVTNPPLRARFNELEEKFKLFAELPVEEKVKVPGYIFKQESAKGHDTIDLKGFIHINQQIDPNDPYTEQLRDMQNVEFPIKGLLKLAQDVFKEGEEFTKRLLTLIGSGAGLDVNFFDEMTRNGVSSLRMLDYPPVIGETHGAMRAEAHEDINLITLLPISRQGGLQVLSTQKDEQGGDIWIDAPTGDDMFVINNGDMLDRLTNKYLPSTPHRVINPSNDAQNVTRLSFPLFFHPRRYKGSDTDLTPLKHFVGKDGIVHYDSITARAYFGQRMKEIGLHNLI